MWGDEIVNVPIENQHIEEWKKKLVKSMRALKYHDNSSNMWSQIQICHLSHFLVLLQILSMDQEAKQNMDFGINCI